MSNLTVDYNPLKLSVDQITAALDTRQKEQFVSLVKLATGKYYAFARFRKEYDQVKLTASALLDLGENSTDSNASHIAAATKLAE
jgi:hypothetical protein